MVSSVIRPYGQLTPTSGPFYRDCISMKKGHSARNGLKTWYLELDGLLPVIFL